MSPAISNPSISKAEYHRMKADDMTEAELQNVIIASANRNGWLVYHTYDSRRSVAGYPDLHLLHRERKLSIFRELKTQKGRVRVDQVGWLEALDGAGVDAAVWRPLDWYDGTILELLIGPTQ